MTSISGGGIIISVSDISLGDVDWGEGKVGKNRGQTHIPTKARMMGQSPIPAGPVPDSRWEGFLLDERGGWVSVPTMALTEAVYYILLSLINPLHGYGIMQNIEILTEGRVRLAAGTLYGALNSMLEKGWIRPLPEERDSRKKEYIMTKQGEKVLRGELLRLDELLSNGKIVLRSVSDETNNF